MTLPASAGTASGLCPLFKRQKIEEQIREFKPDVAALVSEDAAKDLKVRVADTGTKFFRAQRESVNVPLMTNPIRYSIPLSVWLALSRL